MIGIYDTVLLARTKLKTRRIRLTILLVTMSVMFAGLVFVANVASGIVHSLQTFGKEGYGGRFLVEAHPITYQVYGDTALTDQLKPKQDALIAEKTALAKKLDVPYDAASDGSLYYTVQHIGPSNDQPILNFSPLATAALNDQNKTIPGITFGDFADRATTAGAVSTYQSASSNGNIFQGGGNNGGVSVLADGKEDYSNDKRSQYSPTGLQSIQTLGWSQTDDRLLKPFLLDGQTTKVGADGSVPIVAPFSAAEQILGLTSLPATATSAQKLQRLIDVRKKVAGTMAQLCYRNGASQELLQKAIQQQSEIAANKGKSGYSAPHLQYNLPTQACGETTVKQDTRTYDEKQADAAQQKFTDAFTPSAAPVQGIVTLRVVGVSSDVNTGSSLSAAGILGGVLGSTIGTGWFSPASAFTAGSLATQAQGGTVADQPIAQQVYYAEFSSLNAAKSFINATDCNTNGTGMMQINGPYDPNAEVIKCSAQNKPFSVAPYGNNAGAIASFKHNIWKVLKFVLLAVVVIAIIVMVGTFGRVIADSRRETAVFRSLGASRFSISQIYLTYTAMVSVLVIIIALVIGTVGAEVLNSHFSPAISINAVLIYSAHDPHMQFSLIGFNAVYLGAIAGLVLVVGLVSAVIPLLMNMRRNPIRDMRDE